MIDRYQIPEKFFLLQLERLLDGRDVSDLTPHELFGSVDDGFWLWALTAGRRESAVLDDFLPSLPPEEVQIRTNATAGDVALKDGYVVYRLVREIHQAYRGDLESADAILDFGCGWGRILRFFLKDIEPDRIWGVDIWKEQIELCRETSRWGNFTVNEFFPPIDFADGTFDLVFCYSVFSHFSEDAARRWVDEFPRILKPGGLLVATTRDRQFIEQCRAFRDESRSSSSPTNPLAAIFAETEDWLARYDRGEFCYDSSEEIYGDLVSSFGEACIPEEYVRRHWSKRFEILDYIDDRSVSAQNVIVARRKSA
jgi:SAM-dependent methyltransferase